jgi:hypothetical protein
MITNFEYTMITTLNRGLDGNAIRIAASKAFNQAYSRGKLAAFMAKVLRRANGLEILTSQPLTSPRSGNRIISVPIRQIKGTLGRSQDFDSSFNPLNDRSRIRWISVATAFLLNISLPAVELVQVGQSYYVRDGHHRISVAKAMHQEVIDACIVN